MNQQMLGWKGQTNADDPARRSKMDNQESQNRIEALRNAVQHKLRGATADDIAESAEKFFAFLQGNSEKNAIDE